VSRKISCGLARIDAGLDDCLYMGNVELGWGLNQCEGADVNETGRRSNGEVVLRSTLAISVPPRWKPC